MDFTASRPWQLRDNQTRYMEFYMFMCKRLPSLQQKYFFYVIEYAAFQRSNRAIVT